MAEPLGHVLQPGRIGQLTLPHRVIMGAMHLGLETVDDSGAALAAFYAERARGGAGLMVTGGAAVNPAGAGGSRYGVLSDDAFAARLARVVEAVHHAGGLIALQLFHAGRYAPPSPAGPVAPSAVFSRISGCEPAALTDEQIHATIDDFGRGAALARALGFDAIEIMASEGYLIDQFLSPLTNHRDDAWGGDAGRRRRFGVEVTRRVRAAAGELIPVIARFTGADLMDGGVPREDAVEFGRALAAAGADALNIGVGWHESPVPTVQAIVPPGAWVPVAAAIKQGVRMVPVIASNRINRLEIAERVLADGHADFVSLARPFLADPRLIDSSRRARAVNVCIGCNQACIDRSLDDSGPTVSCLVNPRAGRELALSSFDDEPQDPPSIGRGVPGTGQVAGTSQAASGRVRVAVVGGGPAGLHAARELAAAGCASTLFEADGELGGQFRLARRVPGKADYAATIDYLAIEFVRLGGTVRLNRPITAADVELLHDFDAVLVATGVHPRPLRLPGAELPLVRDYTHAFGADVSGRVAIIGGGGIAVDAAHFAADAGAEVHVLYRGSRLGARIGRSTRWAVLAELRRLGVQVHTRVTCRRITPAGVEFEDGDGRAQFVAADTVVVAVGQEPDSTVADILAATGLAHRVVGGARDAAGLDAVRAIAEAHDAARELAVLSARPEPVPSDEAVGRPGGYL